MSADSRPLIVLASPINPDGHALLETEARVVVSAEPTTSRVVELAREAQGVLFRGGPRCDEAFLDACPRLRVVGRHGVGLDTVDIPACTRRGVAVVHAPGSNSQAVAEHALMMMLVCVKKALDQDRRTRAGDWSARRPGVAPGASMRSSEGNDKATTGRAGHPIASHAAPRASRPLASAWGVVTDGSHPSPSSAARRIERRPLPPT